MIDIADRLRRLAIFECSDWQVDLLSAAEEIESLRSALSQISHFVQDVTPNNSNNDGIRVYDKHFARWEYYELISLHSRHPTHTAYHDRTLTPEQRKFFGNYEMTTRAWNVVKNHKLLDYDSLYWASARDLSLHPNIGKVTLGEIARLRRKILEDARKEAA